VALELAAEGGGRRLGARQLGRGAFELLLQGGVGVAAGAAQLVGEPPHLCRMGAHIRLRLGEFRRQRSGVDTNLQGERVSHRFSENWGCI
jgi:hypothetical protein